MNVSNNDLFTRLYSGAARGLAGKSAKVYEELVLRLIYGKYKFGTIIPSAEIVQEFNISRAPLYAALKQLTFEGYIEITPQVGSRVISPTEQQIWDFFQMFALIEKQMARYAAARRSKEDAEAISKICRMVTDVSQPLDAPDEEYIDIVDIYHMAIRKAAHSTLEVRRVSGYFRFAAFLLMNGWPKDFVEVRDNSNLHRPRVTEAIIEGDVEKAGNAVGDYIRYRFVG